MGKKLSDAQIARYERDGFVFPVDAFSPDEARGFPRPPRKLRARGRPAIRQGPQFQAASAVPLGRRLVHHPAVLDAVEDLIGPDIRLFHLTLWPKYAGRPGLCQLAPGRDLFRARAGGACDRLGGADRCAGRVRLHGGGAGQPHARPAAPRPDSTRPTTSCRAARPLTADFDRATRVFMALKAGTDVTAPYASDPPLGAEPVRPPAHRLRHQLYPDLGACRANLRQSAMLVRGVDRYGHFDDEPRPRADYGAAERAFHAAAVARFREANRRGIRPIRGRALTSSWAGRRHLLSRHAAG